MKKRELGQTGIMLSELGYGCTGQFGKDFLGKQCITDEHALSLIATSLELGITFFDTGFNYGYAEERLGRCLSSIYTEGRWSREDIIIQTKGCETLNENGSYGPKDYSPEWIKRSVDISLSRLRTDYIDLYALHGANPEDITDRLIYFLDDLKREGIIRAFGVAGISDDFGEWVCDNKCIDYVMMTYNYARTERESLINRLNENGVAIISGGSLNRSVNTFSFVPHSLNDLWYIARLLRLFRRDYKAGKKYDFINAIDDMTPQQVSLAFILNNDMITSACFNTINIEHLIDNALAADKKLPQSVIDRIAKEAEMELIIPAR